MGKGGSGWGGGEEEGREGGREGGEFEEMNPERKRERHKVGMKEKKKTYSYPNLSSRRA